MLSLRLQENKFSGGIPDCISQLSVLVELQLGGNVLGGHLPSSLGTLKKLSTALNLSSNELKGSIPSQLGDLVDLAILDLSVNNLSGGLAPLGSLRSLYALNLSHNRFSGPVPQNLLQFMNFTPSPFIGNSGLCMSCHDGDSSCKGANVLIPCSSLRKRGVHSRVKIAMICLGSVFVGAFLILCIFLIYRGFKTKLKEELNPFFGESSSKLNEVIESTENFDDKYIIGRGGHGIVYKATLRSGEVYAVKKLVGHAHKILNGSMIREMNTLGQIRHRNLVKLKDFLLKREYGLILYEYMENGSLHDVLHGAERAAILEWRIRYEIALGTAHGLAYLHNDCHPAIIHRDIKPKNILLDKDMVPHISDFGIAKLIDQSPAPSQTTGIVGTVGYMAPGMNGRNMVHTLFCLSQQIILFVLIVFF
jgi:tRNA A-37 threonylcarbamoyl transferase component Bud32